MRAKVGDFHPERCAMRSTEPVRACARQRAALPILWMGPGLTAGLGGSFRTARASGRAGVPACLPAHVHIRCPLRVECSHCLPPSSGHHLCAVWSHGDSLGGPCAARCAAADTTCMHACCVRFAARVCTDCVRTCVCVDVRCDASRVTHAQNSGPLSTQTMILGVSEMKKCIELPWGDRLDA